MTTDFKWVDIHFYTQKKSTSTVKVDGKIGKKPS